MISNTQSNTLENYKRMYEQYVPLYSNLLKTKERLELRLKELEEKGGDVSITDVTKQKIADVDTRIGNLGEAKKQMFSMLEKARLASEQGLKRNKESNAIIAQRDRGIATAAVSRAGGSAGEKLAVQQNIDAESYRRNLAAEEANDKVVSGIYTTASQVPYNIETLNQNEAQINNQKYASDVNAEFSAAQLDPDKRDYFQKQKEKLKEKYSYF